MDDLEHAEEDYELHKHKFLVGAAVTEELTRFGINPDDVTALDLYFENLPPQKEAFYYYYQDYLHHLPKAGAPNSNATNVQFEKNRPTTGREISHKDSPFLDEVLKNWQKIKAQTTKPSTVQSYVEGTNLFLKIVTEFYGRTPRIHELNRELIQNYKDTFQAIPKWVKTTEARVCDLVRMDGPRKSPVTLKKTYINVGTFLKWVKDKGYEIDEKLHGLLLLDTDFSNRDRKKRVPWDNEDLKNIFSSKKYIKKPFSKACDYWSPLIALFTGATLGEIVQLYVSDIKSIENIAVFDINDEFDKQLKVEGGRTRMVPVHAQLIKLGFLDFVKHQKSIGETKLFPAEERNTRNIFGDYSKRFSYFRDKVGAGPRHEMEFRDFHSFRHLVRTRLEEADVNSGLIDDIVGHTSTDRSIGKKVYSHAQLLKQKQKALAKLKYSIDFDEIATWRRTSFGRKLVGLCKHG